MTELTDLRETFLKLNTRNLCCRENYKKKKLVNDQLLLQVKNASFEMKYKALERNSIDLQQIMEEQNEISHDTLLLVEKLIDRLEKTELGLKETRLDLKEMRDKLDRMEIYLINTATVLKETKEKGAETQNELREMRIELKNIQGELKDTKAKTKLLSTYRDWIGIFNVKLRSKLGREIFYEIEDAFDDNNVYNVDISQYPCIKNLENKLKEFKMSYKEFKRLYDMKGDTFHKDPNQTVSEAKKRLREDLFPDDQKNLIVPLHKLFVALEAWAPDHHLTSS
jgi:hypothetical protein